MVAARSCPLELRLKAAITIVSLCTRICYIGTASKRDIFPPFQRYRTSISSHEQPPLSDMLGVPTTQLLHGKCETAALTFNQQPKLCPARETAVTRAAVCLHMLELCLAKSDRKGVLQQTAFDTWNRWRQAGGCTTDQVCRCGAESSQTNGVLNITVENASELWWPVDFNWLDS